MKDLDQSPPATPAQRANHPARDPMFDTVRIYCPVCRECFFSTLIYDCPHCGSEDLRWINTANVGPGWFAWFDSDPADDCRYVMAETADQATDQLIAEYGE